MLFQNVAEIILFNMMLFCSSSQGDGRFLAVEFPLKTVLFTPQSTGSTNTRQRDHTSASDSRSQDPDQETGFRVELEPDGEVLSDRSMTGLSDEFDIQSGSDTSSGSFGSPIVPAKCPPQSRDLTEEFENVAETSPEKMTEQRKQSSKTRFAHDLSRPGPGQMLAETILQPPTASGSCNDQQQNCTEKIASGTNGSYHFDSQNSDRLLLRLDPSEMDGVLSSPFSLTNSIDSTIDLTMEETSNIELTPQKTPEIGNSQPSPSQFFMKQTKISDFIKVKPPLAVARKIPCEADARREFGQATEADPASTAQRDSHSSQGSVSKQPQPGTSGSDHLSKSGSHSGSQPKSHKPAQPGAPSQPCCRSSQPLTPNTSSLLGPVQKESITPDKLSQSASSQEPSPTDSSHGRYEPTEASSKPSQLLGSHRPVSQPHHSSPLDSCGKVSLPFCLSGCSRQGTPREGSYGSAQCTDSQSHIPQPLLLSEPFDEPKSDVEAASSDMKGRSSWHAPLHSIHQPKRAPKKRKPMRKSTKRISSDSSSDEGSEVNSASKPVRTRPTKCKVRNRTKVHKTSDEEADSSAHQHRFIPSQGSDTSTDADTSLAEGQQGPLEDTNSQHSSTDFSQDNAGTFEAQPNPLAFDFLGKDKERGKGR